MGHPPSRQKRRGNGCNNFQHARLWLLLPFFIFFSIATNSFLLYMKEINPQLDSFFNLMHREKTSGDRLNPLMLESSSSGWSLSWTIDKYENKYTTENESIAIAETQSQVVSARVTTYKKVHRERKSLATGSGIRQPQTEGQKDLATSKSITASALKPNRDKIKKEGVTKLQENLPAQKPSRDRIKKEDLTKLQEYQVKKPYVPVDVDNLQALSPNATFSACLLIRDDNEILSEWIAYHYHVLKLRDIIVAIDPNSETSPSAILDRWKDRINIETWSDDMYMPTDFVQSKHIPKSEVTGEKIKLEKKFKNIKDEEMFEIISHRYRQRVFLARCIQSLKKKDKTWTIHIDTDEFVMASKLLRQMNPKQVNAPPIEEPGSVLSLLQHQVKHLTRTVGYPCISVLRVLFGSVESEPEERDEGVPLDFNSSRFETTRWQYHAPPHDKSQHGYGKVIMDISGLPSYFFEYDVVFSIHRPLASVCRSHEEISYGSFMRYPITAAHYLGSWERYSARNDKRRSREIYDRKAFVQKGKDDGLKFWLKGFMEDVGKENAVALLGEEYLRQKE